MKNIIIAGPGRTGKSTLARKINEELNYFVIGLDKLVATFGEAYPQLDIRLNWDYEDVYCKGYINRTQIQYTAKGSSVADSRGFARKRRADENTSTSECHALLFRIA